MLPRAASLQVDPTVHAAARSVGAVGGTVPWDGISPEYHDPAVPADIAKVTLIPGETLHKAILLRPPASQAFAKLLPRRLRGIPEAALGPIRPTRDHTNNDDSYSRCDDCRKYDR